MLCIWHASGLNVVALNYLHQYRSKPQNHPTYTWTVSLQQDIIQPRPRHM